MYQQVSQVYMVLILIILVISFISVFSIVRRQKVTEEGLLWLSLWFFIASPLTFYFASAGLNATELAQETYFQNLWKKQYGDLSFINETADSLIHKSINLTGSINREKLFALLSHELFHGFFKIFVPLVMAAIGAWAIVKYLDSRISVIPNK